MAEKVVIVESPAKVRTIRKVLGSGYQVQASMGHVRDLPKSKLGVDVEAGFVPTYTVPRDKARVVRELRQAVERAAEVYLATDPDREGEAIAWHIVQVTRPEGKPVYRVVFHEVTPPAVREAFAHPRDLDMHLVEAQQARRILDRLVGYQISPLLWKKVRRGLSAGRVQSVAVRLVVEREREIAAFQPQEYWTVEADLAKIPPPGQARRPEDVFRAVLVSIRGKKLGRFDLKAREEAQAVVDELEGAAYRVLRLRRKEVQRRPLPPFITSTLQQEASRRLGMAPGRTMRIAQQLYEGVELGEEGSVGLITYMRTDSTAVSPLAQEEARALIAGKWGDAYLPPRPPVYKTKVALAQEAHEAIRPTSVYREPEAIRHFLDRDQFRLYELIWKRFLASQMAPALLEQTVAEIEALPPSGGGEFLFRATGSVVRFPGFLVVYREEEGGPSAGEKFLPPLAEGEPLDLVQLLALQHFTEPPPRYTEATLIRELEKRGIGRPSTYAPIMETIRERGYVERVEPRRRNSPLRPTELGFLVNDLLVAHFPDILDYRFTSQMEERLDKIAAGALARVPVLEEFHRHLSAELSRAEAEMRDFRREAEPTDVLCEVCGRPMVIRWGKNGPFLSCSGYPECKNACDFVRTPEGKVVPVERAGRMPAPTGAGISAGGMPASTAGEEPGPAGEMPACEKCGRPMTVKRGRYGPFLACTGYPECRNTRPLPSQGEEASGEESAEVCEKCGRPMVLRRGRYGPFLACTGYPECRNTRKVVARR